MNREIGDIPYPKKRKGKHRITKETKKRVRAKARVTCAMCGKDITGKVLDHKCEMGKI